MTMSLPDRALCQRRLAAIFPQGVELRGRLTNQLAASAVFVFLYADAVGQRRLLRPSMVLWMCDEAAARTSSEERNAWYEAALAGKRSLAALLATWGIDHKPWYADNTREPLRDEAFRAWARYGAVVRDETVATTSSSPQWSLDEEFAALFEPDLQGEPLDERIEDWRDDHLGPVGRARVAVARRLAGGADVDVALPDGSTRRLASGGSSLILKGVIEEFAPRVLGRPAVLTISESRRHVDVVDQQLLDELGLRLDAGRLLPDAVLFDADPGHFWFVEAVFTDGAIDEGRRNALEDWAGQEGIAADRCRYLTAFVSRTAPAFRRLAPVLAWNSAAWFVDEPDHIVWLDLPA
jgi:hypothetical protein